MNQILIDLIIEGNLNEIQKYHCENLSNIHSIDVAHSFYFACINGHFDIAQWLYKIEPNINMWESFYDVFCVACINGHLDVAQWLYEIKPDVNIPKDTLIDALSSKHQHVLRWLYYIIYEKAVGHKCDSVFPTTI